MLCCAVVALSVSPVRLVKLWDSPYDSTYSYARTVLTARHDEPGIVFTVPFPNTVMWLDAKSRRLRVLAPEGRLPDQFDCGQGSATFSTGQDAQDPSAKWTTMDISTGKVVRSGQGPEFRCGDLIYETLPEGRVRTASLSRGVNLWERDAKDTAEIPAFPGWPIWSSPKMRLFIKGRPGRDDKDIYAVRPGATRPFATFYCSPYARRFTRLIGNPDAGSFAVVESSNRSDLCTAVYGSGFRRVDLNLGRVEAAQGQSIYWRKAIPREFDGPDIQYEDTLRCYDTRLEKDVWKTQSHGYFYQRYKAWLISDSEVLSARTGKRIGRYSLPSGESPIARNGSYIVTVKPAPQGRITVWRLQFSPTATSP